MMCAMHFLLQHMLVLDVFFNEKLSYISRVEVMLQRRYSRWHEHTPLHPFHSQSSVLREGRVSSGETIRHLFTLFKVPSFAPARSRRHAFQRAHSGDVKTTAEREVVGGDKIKWIINP